MKTLTSKRPLALLAYFSVPLFLLLVLVLLYRDDGKMVGRGQKPVNFSWIEKNRLAAMGYPRSAANVEFLVDQGIRHLVTLSPEMQPPVRDFAHVLRWTQIAVEEFEPPSLEDMVRFVGICEGAFEKGEAVGVHCRQGLGRTGVMAAVYLVRFQDLTPEVAIGRVRAIRPYSIETYQQELAVRRYFDYLRGTTMKSA